MTLTNVQKGGIIGGIVFAVGVISIVIMATLGVFGSGDFLSESRIKAIEQKELPAAVDALKGTLSDATIALLKKANFEKDEDKTAFHKLTIYPGEVSKIKTGDKLIATLKVYELLYTIHAGRYLACKDRACLDKQWPLLITVGRELDDFTRHMKSELKISDAFNAEKLSVKIEDVAKVVADAKVKDAFKALAESTARENEILVRIWSRYFREQDLFRQDVLKKVP
jgi:hypothetical protein